MAQDQYGNPVNFRYSQPCLHGYAPFQHAPLDRIEAIWALYQQRYADDIAQNRREFRTLATDTYVEKKETGLPHPGPFAPFRAVSDKDTFSWNVQDRTHMVVPKPPGPSGYVLTAIGGKTAWVSEDHYAKKLDYPDGVKKTYEQEPVILMVRASRGVRGPIVAINYHKGGKKYLTFSPSYRESIPVLNTCQKLLKWFKNLLKK